MTEAERMAALAKTLQRLSDELLTASGEYSKLLAWHEHADQVRNMSALLSIYANQFNARLARMVEL